MFPGRPRKLPDGKVWLEREIPAAIRPEGWRDWHDAARKGDVYYAEWRCEGPGADRSGRVAWSRELTDAHADVYDTRCIFAPKTGPAPFRDDRAGFRE